MWHRVRSLFYPLLRTRVERELEEARHGLLTAQAHFHYYQAMVSYYEIRVRHLEGEL